MNPCTPGLFAGLLEGDCWPCPECGVSLSFPLHAELLFRSLPGTFTLVIVNVVSAIAHAPLTLFCSLHPTGSYHTDTPSF